MICDVGLDGLGARLVAGLELLDQLGVDAADEADRAGRGLQRGRDAGEERALVLGEQQAGDVVTLGAVGVRAVDLGEGRCRGTRAATSPMTSS